MILMKYAKNTSFTNHENSKGAISMNHKNCKQCGEELEHYLEQPRNALGFCDIHCERSYKVDVAFTRYINPAIARLKAKKRLSHG